MTQHIIVVGDIATDVVARIDGPLNVGSDAPATIATYGGGSAANVAAWLGARTPVDVVFVGRVGGDAVGRSVVEELSAAGVDVRARVDPGSTTGCVVVLVDATGERTMLPDRGASAALSRNDLPVDVFIPGRHLHLSGYPLLDESSRDAGLAALSLARSTGMTVSVDASSAIPLAEVGPDKFLEWTAGADLCLANLEEALILAGQGTPDELARRLAATAYGAAVVKCGADGALWSDGVSVVSVPAVPARVVDTTGAGDAFAAGFLAAWRTAPPHDALAAGARLASTAVATPGARPPVTG